MSKSEPKKKQIRRKCWACEKSILGVPYVKFKVRHGRGKDAKEHLFAFQHVKCLPMVLQLQLVKSVAEFAGVSETLGWIGEKA